MNKRIITWLALMHVSLSAYASEFKWNDKWHGRDKDQHAMIGVIIGSSVTTYTNDPWIGASAGCGVGVVKELSDMRPRHTASFQDIIITCLGSGIGAYVTDQVRLSPNSISFNKRF